MKDIVIIGAGPAGLTAAIYALRAGKSVLVLEKELFGGQITYSPSVENYPGYKQISGNEFAENLIDQATSLGAEIELAEVVQILEGPVKTVITDGGRYECRSVIIASGSRHRHLGLPREEELVGAGVSYCAVCDGAFFKGKTVAVAGGGDAALQDAILLFRPVPARIYHPPPRHLPRRGAAGSDPALTRQRRIRHGLRHRVARGRQKAFRHHRSEQEDRRRKEAPAGRSFRRRRAGAAERAVCGYRRPRRIRLRRCRRGLRDKGPRHFCRRRLPEKIGPSTHHRCRRRSCRRSCRGQLYQFSLIGNFSDPHRGRYRFKKKGSYHRHVYSG